MGQPTLEVQLKNARAELKRLQNPQTLIDALARVRELEDRLAKKEGRERRTAARERLQQPSEEALRDAKVAGILMVMAGSLSNPTNARIVLRKLMELGLTEAEAQQRMEAEVALRSV